MQMVAASKMRRAQEREWNWVVLIQMVYAVSFHIWCKAQSDYKHPYMINRPVNRVGFIGCDF